VAPWLNIIETALRRSSVDVDDPGQRLDVLAHDALLVLRLVEPDHAARPGRAGRP
jgi:hypothetical protein